MTFPLQPYQLPFQTVLPDAPAPPWLSALLFAENH